MRLIQLLTLMFLSTAVRGAPSGPSIVHLIAFDYPRLAHLAAAQGQVEVNLSIDGSGNVKAVSLVSGNGFLVDQLVGVLKEWTFTPCTEGGAACIYPMKLVFILEGSALDISQCKSTFTFDNPGLITVRSQFAKAIIN